MIKKLDIYNGYKIVDWLHTIDGRCGAIEVNNKINEIADAVNAIQKEHEAERFEIQEWIGILEAVRKSVNIHEKQIDELQMKLEPEKCEPAENAYTKTCRMDKEFAEEELKRTHKALDVAVDTLKWIDETYESGQELETDIWAKCQYALEQITALEQKD